MRERHEFICNLPVCSNCSKIAKYSRHMIYIKNVLENLKTSTYVMHYYSTYFYDIVHRMLLGRKKYFAKNEIPYRNFETTK